MSLDRCIISLKETGLLDEERAAFFAEQFDDLRKQYRKTMSEAAADAAATRDTVTAAERLILQSRRQKLLQIRAQEAIVGRVQAGLARGGSAADVAVAHFDHVEGMPGVPNIEARRRAVMGQAHSMMNGLLAKFSHDLLGRTRNAADLANVVREAFGQDTGDVAAKELARSWADTAEMLRQRFNAAGGHIGKRQDWGLPQVHLSEKVRQVTYEQWRDFIVPLLDLTRTVDGETGRALTPRQLDKALRNSFASIRSEGMDDITPGARGNPRLANQRGDSRFLIFKDADAWSQYQQRFGAENPWDAMMGHIDGMARDIAQMEILGPAPNQTVAWLTDLLEQEVRTSAAAGKLFTKVKDRAVGARSEIRRMMAIYNGEVNRPVNSTLARGFATVRAVQTAAKLGGAMLSATTDLGFQRVTAKFNGLQWSKILKNYVRLLNPLDAADREFAVSSGLIAEEAAARMGALWRYDDAVNTPEVARRLASGVIRLSGLSAWTQAGKWAFGMEFMHALGRAAEQPWDGLSKGLRGALERYGFDAGSWDTLRASPRYEHKGAKYLRPEEVTDDALKTQFLEMMLQEEQLAVPQASLRSRAVMTGGLQAGTVGGELWRSAMQFKAFPVSVMMTHGVRMLSQKGVTGKAAYLANLLIATTAFGALAMQMKQVAAGKDPRDMKDAKFWGAALAQGGGAGLIGDFIGADTNRYGGSIYQTLAGPLIGTGIGALDVTLGNLKQGAAGEKTNVGRELVQFAKANTPGSSLWYTRLAFERIFWDQVQQQLDPQAHKAWGRIEKKMRKEYDQQFYWAPGDTEAERAPDFEAIDGGSQ